MPELTPRSRIVSAVEDPTVIIRNEKHYKSGTEAEFNLLQQLYDIAPDHVAKPIQLLTDDKGQVIGYEREEVEGITVFNYIREHATLPIPIQIQISHTLALFHLHGLAHGDPTARNICITPEGNVKFIDPVGYNPHEETPKEIEKLIDHDNRTLTSLLAKLPAA